MSADSLTLGKKVTKQSALVGERLWSGRFLSSCSFEHISRISSHPTVFFSHNKPVNSTFSHNNPVKWPGCFSPAEAKTTRQKSLSQPTYERGASAEHLTLLWSVHLNIKYYSRPYNLPYIQVSIGEGFKWHGMGMQPANSLLLVFLLVLL
jgi:hypothetical protein